MSAGDDVDDNVPIVAGSASAVGVLAVPLSSISRLRGVG
jgi:hypothetical protein